MKITRKNLENLIREEIGDAMKQFAQGALDAHATKEQKLEKIIARVKEWANEILSQEPTSEREKAIHELAKLIKIENDPTKLAKLQLAIAFMGYTPSAEMDDGPRVEDF